MGNSILDDAEHLLDHTIGAKLIASLGETSPAKSVSYGSTSRALGGTPQCFVTTSPLCVIANKSTAHEDIRSRALTLYFDPTNLEIHRAVARWYWDQEIHDWFGQHIYRLTPLDTRWYVTAELDKRAGRNWKEKILEAWAVNRACAVVQDLERDPAYPTREDKARQFESAMSDSKGASRATYFRIRKRLEEEQRLVVEPAAPIPLTRTKAPGTPSPLELNSLAAPSENQDEQPRRLDVPIREQFARPIRGDLAPRIPPKPMVLDDVLPWENPPEAQDEDIET